ncbi:hypothetical protein BDV06DRAFT_225196 [Aspergillus oleicola]
MAVQATKNSPNGVSGRLMAKNKKTTTKPFDEYIPAQAGRGDHRKRVQGRTLTYWLILAGAGLAAFTPNEFAALSPKTRAAALSLVFPGAGYLACLNLKGAVLLVLTYLFLPVCLFAWFGAGGLGFPVGLWVLSIGGAYWAASPSAIWNNAGWLAGALLLSFFLVFNRHASKARRQGALRRNDRNQNLPRFLEAVTESVVAPPGAEDRELTLDELRWVQWLFDVGMQDIDDFSNYGIIDQFQTASLRYQIYELMYCLAMYQGIYAPNFHGYCSTVYRRSITKSLTPRVLGFWKWETLWGKFRTDFDPVREDNIMVTGFVLQAVALYVANTGDMRYTEPGSLTFNVSEKHSYQYDIHSLSKALVSQWTINPYTLFSCEPNWIYTPCNLQGIVGQVVYDRMFGTSHATTLQSKFEYSFTSEFMEPDGSILPIRSELTGFTIPGLCGVLTDLVNAMMCRGHMDHIARRMWAIFRNSNLHFNNKDQLELVGLVGADMVDPGNYRSSPQSMLPAVAHTAGEFGDERVRMKALEKLNRELARDVSKTGSVRWSPKQASFVTTTNTVKAMLLRNEDWRKLVTEGPSEMALKGPILDQVPYPGVLVAKARSHTSRDLNLVLYPSAKPGRFEIGIKRLRPNVKYIVKEQDLSINADEEGNATLKIFVDGRTVLTIDSVEQS